MPRVAVSVQFVACTRGAAAGRGTHGPPAFTYTAQGREEFPGRGQLLTTQKTHNKEQRAVGPAVVLHKLEHRGRWDQ